MILRECRGELLIYLQTDHGVLTGELARLWGSSPFQAVEPLAAVKLAADLHDEGWADWEHEPQVDPATGRPYSFMSVPQDQHVQIYRRSVETALAKHPYAGLLVSLHGCGLYNGRQGLMPLLGQRPIAPECGALVEEFLAEQTVLQRALMQELLVDEVTLWTHYRWLQAWDTISVFVCLRDPGERSSMAIGLMPESAGGQEHMMTISGVGESTFTVTPWPFSVRRIESEIPVRVMPNRRYEDDSEFREAFAAAPTRRQTLCLVK